MFMIGQIAMDKIKYFSVIFEFWDEAGSVWWGIAPRARAQNRALQTNP